MPKARKEYNMPNQLTTKEHLNHCEKMAEFWKKTCPQTAGQYIKKAKILREKLEIII